jgi:hypothetical protein
MEREVPEYVKQALDRLLTLEATNPEEAGPKIAALSEKWGF